MRRPQPRPASGAGPDGRPPTGGGRDGRDGRGGRGGNGEYAGGLPPARRRTFRRRRIIALLALLVVGWLIFMVAVPVSAWSSVERVDNVPAKRPSPGAGTNILLVGSDSRAGLSDADAAAIGTDNIDVGRRADSIMIVHITAGGGTTAVISIPRDSYVPIPGHGSNKINAAYAFGGAKLLTQTVEDATGIRLDGYVEIGFGGFASIVDSLGGIDICLTKALKDPLVDLDLAPGCHLLTGKDSLAFVRTRHADARGDLGRADRQRQFLAALMKKAATPATVLNPVRYAAFTRAASKGVTIGSDTSLGHAVSVFQALRAVGSGDAVSLLVPIDTASYQTKNAGVAVKWNDKAAKELFGLIQQDKPITVPSTG